MVRITTPNMVLWRRYRLPYAFTSDDVQSAVRTAARHIAPQGGHVRLCYQVPLLASEVLGSEGKLPPGTKDISPAAFSGKKLSPQQPSTGEKL